ncbi:hypothetical protein [Streptomyces scopuliridis]|uniref:Uncharacterized protein n=1 Tax=Streptomyces scopuliridis RB72 TaxID=1440053 RepID=A0A2T7T628_9ACTN|nr:hypothetical protein [Streptomyces scopuliridis]PVE10589.1 hypothetical protein Y717_28270 [Streptomyces scopuliridis RB72]
MAFCRRTGDIPPKRHTLHPRPGGGTYNEELAGEEGFSTARAPRTPRLLRGDGNHRAGLLLS